MIKPQIIIQPHWGQLVALRSSHKVIILRCGRGWGKSTAIAKRVIDLAHAFPRGTVYISGPSYKYLMKFILPSILHGLEMWGYKNGFHFWYQQRPPKGLNIPTPFKFIGDYEKAFQFYTGCIFQLISQDVPNDGRGGNADAAIIDEAGYQDKDMLDENVFLSLRGSSNTFKGHHLMESVFYASTIPLVSTGRWFLNLKQLAIENPKEYLHLSGTAYINRRNLSPNYFKNLKQLLPAWKYSIEVDNEEPEKVEDCFYGYLNKGMYYVSNNNSFIETLELGQNMNCLSDSDVDPNRELHIGWDAGGIINSLAIGQWYPNKNLFRYIKSMYVITPKTHESLAEELCEYYEPMINKSIILHSDSFAEQDFDKLLSYKDGFIRILKSKGWKVKFVPYNPNVKHQQKHLLFSKMHQTKDRGIPRVEYNKENCSDMIYSLENTKAIEVNVKGRKYIIKDKSLEKKLPVAEQHKATHLSDAHDKPLWNLFSALVDTKKSFFGQSFGT